MELAREDTAEVTVVLADYFVLFEVPALDLFVFASGEEVGGALT